MLCSRRALTLVRPRVRGRLLGSERPLHGPANAVRTSARCWVVGRLHLPRSSWKGSFTQGYVLNVRLPAVATARFCHHNPADLPPHHLVKLPALSPTMEQGTIVQWEKQEGDLLEEGDVIAQVETDKATMDMETPSTGYLAKILVPAGSKDLALGSLLAVIVEEESNVVAFKDYHAPTQESPLVATPTTSPVSSATPPQVPSDFPSHSVVKLPALSPTMEQGTIVQWEKQEGDLLEEGDVIAQVETDKATMDMETPSAGYLAKIIVPAGSKDLALGSLLAIIVEEESSIASFKDYQPSAVSDSATPQPKTVPSDTTRASAIAQESDQGAASNVSYAAVQSRQPQGGISAPVGRIIASPYAKTIAREKGVDLQNVVGTGSSGRIVSKDILKYAESAPKMAAAPSVMTASGEPFEDVPLTGMRKTIAKRLQESKQTIPHYYLSVDIEMDEVMIMRSKMNDAASGSYKLSVNDFIVKASALALKEIPEANSSWMDTFIRKYNTVDISVAVSTDRGLITPIITDADLKTLRFISTDMRELAEKARSGKLQPHEFQGGTFTISNLGMYGIRNFSAVINPPQSCILAVGATEKRLMVDEDEEDRYRAANIMSVTLSCDHRVVDGAIGAQWLAAFKSYLEKPFKMLV